MLHIAMIGYGAIGASALQILQNNKTIVVDGIVVPKDMQDNVVKQLNSLHATPQLWHQLAADYRPDLLVECAGHSAIEEHVIPALKRGIRCLVVSVGALSDSDLAARLEQAAIEGNTQLELLSGAIGGIDALAAAKYGGLTSVVYTGKKPAKSWKGTPAEQAFDLDSLQQKTVIFKGTARDAARLYPKNANVAATLSLAGIGLDNTQVELIADPDSQENIHHFVAEGSFGRFEVTLCGNPLKANPKTSALTVYSVVRAISNHVHPVFI